MKKTKLNILKNKITALFGIICILVLSFIVVGDAGDDDIYKDVKFRYKENNAFGYGEKFEYDVQYGFIKAGEGTIQIMPKPLNIKGREAYDIRFEARSLKSLEFLYKVHDRYRTALDVQGIFPWVFEQRIREGGYKHDFKAFFDQMGHKAYANDKVYPIPEYVHDVVSAFYYVRTLDLGNMKKGSIVSVQNFWRDSTYTLGVKIHGKTITEVPAGKFRCVVVEPVDLQGGLFRNIGSIYVYVTDDDRKMPVKVATKVLIGEVSAEMTKYSGLRGPLNSIIK